MVGFLGDGINDAPAMRAADIGISVDTCGGYRERGCRYHFAGKAA
jgi:magnesium-transporting ATPase (P-type)